MKIVILGLILAFTTNLLANSTVPFIVHTQDPNSPTTCVVYVVDEKNGTKIPFIVPNPNYPNGRCPQ